MAGDAARASAPAGWPRRALVGLWLVAFLAAGVGLFLRWDSLVSRLAEAPSAADAGGIAR